MRRREFLKGLGLVGTVCAVPALALAKLKPELTGLVAGDEYLFGSTRRGFDPGRGWPFQVGDQIQVHANGVDGWHTVTSVEGDSMGLRYDHARNEFTLPKERGAWYDVPGTDGVRIKLKDFADVRAGASHTPEIHPGCYQVGSSLQAHALEYNRGPSEWLHQHAIVSNEGVLRWYEDDGGDP